MKTLIVGMTIVLLYAGAGMAQVQGEQVQGDKPATTEPPGVTLVTGNESKHAREADARHCLVMKNNLEIIRCAEKYRYVAVAKKGGT